MRSVIELAKEAGFEVEDDWEIIAGNTIINHEVSRFAALVRAERQWVDLTDDEIEEAFKSASKIMKPWEPVKAVIAAFKEKNK